MAKPTFYEFFAGGGMARAGLGPSWRCLLANDLDPKKARSYRENFGAADLICADVADLTPRQAPGAADLAWASFPCQDLSLAGAARGLGGEGDLERSRSGAFWPFWRLIQALAAEDRAPRLIALENVVGLLTSDQGRDFGVLLATLLEGGYRPGVLHIDARLFLPQSRPRLFIIAVRADLPVAGELLTAAPHPAFRPPALEAALGRLPPGIRNQLLDWRLPLPPRRRQDLKDLLEPAPADVALHPAGETRRLLESMSPHNAGKLSGTRAAGGVGAVYRRTRRLPDGRRVVRAEVRLDGLAGCLRTPAGGSSRQMLLFADEDPPRSRLISAREAARLMGLPEAYRLPAGYSDAYHLVGDGVCPPIVRHLARHLLEPLLEASGAPSALAAE